MTLYERRYYEAALTLCLGFKEEGAETSKAIEKTIEVFKDIVCDVKDLRNYLTSFIY